jgi:hypothetical protein
LLLPLETNTFLNTVDRAGLTLPHPLLLIESTSSEKEHGPLLTFPFKTLSIVVMLEIAMEETTSLSMLTLIPTESLMRLATTTKLSTNNAILGPSADPAELGENASTIPLDHTPNSRSEIMVLFHLEM